ncbi:MAG TPA: hypothetical protein DCZ01_12830 [Elusimicrobia bacterium]|nr:MAG: hypothetical protein A2X37_11665 [Elusimicrobia bacterium GWA2_66_18]OGR70196.1 MAG: hypothetical protein A2X40_04525 [Elusimicrobia bacterium GWC2_65_9]HAZ09371.1 hypothetical protein [Elusimicrobiota bacterium]
MATAAAFILGAVLGGAVAAALAAAVLRARAALYGRLFSFALHEISTPVTAVNMTVLNFLSGVFGPVPDDQVKWVEMNRDQMARLSALVGELRDLIHLELKRDLKPTFLPADPEEVLNNAVSNLSRGFEQAGAELIILPEKGLPPVDTDAERASRSLASLLFHARKFRTAGPVRVRSLRVGTDVAFEVAYTGPPLSPAEVGRSLDLFYPARPRRDELICAIGLGLGLVRAVVENIRGRLKFSVDKSGESRLSIIFPTRRSS